MICVWWYSIRKLPTKAQCIHYITANSLWLNHQPTTGTIVSSSKNITLQSKSCSFSTFSLQFLNNFSETSFSRFATEIVVWSFHTTSSLRSQLLLQIKIQQVLLSEDYEKTYEKFITLHWCQLLFYISPLRLDIFWIRNNIARKVGSTSQIVPFIQ